MSDIVERLKTIIVEGELGSLGLSDAPEIAEEAIAEIERLRHTIEQLRAVAGPVSLESGLAFSEIKKEIRDGKDTSASGN